LAFVIRYVRGWLLLNEPERFSQRRIAWFTNLGLPAANLDAANRTPVYRVVGCAAAVAAAMQGTITDERTRLCLSNDSVQKAAQSPTMAEAIGVSIIPEVTAAVSGFTKSNATADGLYFMADVGAMTFDACMFRFRRGGADDLYSLLRAEVRPLGADAFHWFAASGRTEEGFVEQCDRMLRQVVWDTKREGDPAAATWRAGNYLSMFLVGGGAKNTLHQKVVAAARASL